MTIHIGISACVLGEKVRYDGGHKNSLFCSVVLASFVRYLPICPEQAIGMPTPRPAIRLLKTDAGDIRLVNSKDSSIDFTEQMQLFTDHKMPLLAQLSGYIVCAKSPSCGMERVRLVNEKGELLGKVGTGIFTQRLMQKYPWLPVEEDGRLLDAELKENFITRVYALSTWHQLIASGFSVGKLVAFHSQFKFLIMAHHPTAYRELGRLVAHAKLFATDDLAERYLHDFMRALKQPATRKQHANVLMHLQGFFKKLLSPTAKQELLSLIHQYRLGHAPLMAPLTLLKHHLSLHPHQYVAAQRYLLPYPVELGLRA
mgnify:CR=1 FL=1